MEGALFKAEGIFTRDLDKNIGEEADNLNDETFGFNDDYCEWNDDWEKHHEQLVEVENKRLSYSRDEFISPKDSLTDLNASFDGKNKDSYIDSSDEDDIIESSISLLGLDDDYQFVVKPNRSPNIEFKESKQSWTSPTRIQDHQSDSLQELISPGEGVWASPSREQLLGSHVNQDMAEKQYDGNIAKKLIYGHEFESNGISVPTSSPIHVQDLERELINQNKTKKWSQPTIIEKHNTQLPASNIIHPTKTNVSPLPHGVPLDPHLSPQLFPGINQAPFDINMMTSLLMYQQHMKIHTQQIMHRVIPPLLSPFHLADPMLFGNPNHQSIHQQSIHQQHSYRKKPNDWTYKSPRYNNTYDSYRKDNQYEQNYWQKEMRHPTSSDIDYEQFIQMGPSKLMNAKEKKWIFKISLMSLLSGDPNISDYYFISLVNKNFLSEVNENKESSKNVEKTNQLVNYAQQQQQTKESHKPVKFKGSLGKLSITSVHHPRQIMDFSSEPESKVQETGKGKFILYGMVEKMYSILLTIIDMERELIDAKEPEKTLSCRSEKINELFEFFKIELHNSQIFSDTSHFGNLMSISKARKLLTRVFLLFNQEHSESLLVSVINVLPALLRRDKEQNMLQFIDKVQIMLNRSTKNLKLKCVKLMRKIDLKIILIYPTGILMLATILDSLEEKDAAISLEWSYYVDEIPKVLLAMSEDILLKNQIQLDHLRSVVGINISASISSIIEE